MTSLTRVVAPLREVKTLDRAGAPGVFEGYGSVFGTEDSYGDVVAKGAFDASLRRWREERQRLPPMLLQHGGSFLAGAEDLVPIGVWDEMREDDHGLYVKGRLLALDTDLGKRVHAAMAAGALDGLSIGFVPREVVTGKSPKEPARTLTAVDLWEVSVVTYPANGDARVTAVKQLSADMAERDVERVLREAGLSRKEAMTVIAKGWRALRDARDDGQQGKRGGALSAAEVDALKRRFLA